MRTEGAGMTRAIPREKLDEATRKRIRDLIKAVSGDGDRGNASRIAAERLLVLAPNNAVTAELVVFVERVLAIAVSHCPRCLDPSVGLCTPCRAAHAIEFSEATRVRQGRVTLAPVPQVARSRGALADRDLDELIAECTRKKRYVSQIDADRVAAKRGALSGVALRSYSCTAGCGGWHITHKPQRAS